MFYRLPVCWRGPRQSMSLGGELQQCVVVKKGLCVGSLHIKLASRHTQTHSATASMLTKGEAWGGGVG